MKLAQVNQVMETAPKGANIILEWVRPCKVKKGAPSIEKAVRMVGRVGVEYDNQKAVQEKRSNGELPSENQGLPKWQEWVKYPFLLRHKSKGTLYLRLYKGTSKKVKPFVKWFVDGKEVDLESIRDWLYAQETKGHSDSDCFNVKIEDLTQIASETADYGKLV